MIDAILVLNVGSSSIKFALYDLDTIELLFSALPDESVIRGELNRLFRWCKDRGLTVVVTGERGKLGNLTKFGIEEYVSDCVITLDHRVHDEISTRRLRVANQG